MTSIVDIVIFKVNEIEADIQNYNGFQVIEFSFIGVDYHKKSVTQRIRIHSEDETFSKEKVLDIFSDKIKIKDYS
jgi:hypothetical protein